MASFEVLREMDGDRPYAVGDVREAEPEAVAHLVACGALREVGPAADIVMAQNHGSRKPRANRS